MMRVIESGSSVHMVMTEEQSIGVDTPNDLQVVESKMTNDLLMAEYA